MPLHVSKTMCSTSEGQNCIIQHILLRESSLNLRTGRPPIGLMIPDAV